MVAVLAHALAVIRRDKFGGTGGPGPGRPPWPSTTTRPEIFTGGPSHPCEVRQSRHPDRLQGGGGRRRPAAGGHAPPGDAPRLRHPAGGIRPGGAGFGEGRRQALGPSQVPGGTEGGQPGVAQSAAQQTRAALDAFHLPELDYFLAEFLPAFPLTLDELQADAQA